MKQEIPDCCANHELNRGCRQRDHLNTKKCRNCPELIREDQILCYVCYRKRYDTYLINR